MANFLRSPVYRAIRVTAPTAGLTAGAMQKTEDTVGVIFEDKDLGGTTVLVYQAEKIIVPKVTGTGKSFAIGDKVFYDDSSKKVTPTSAQGLFLVGIATEAAGINDTTVEIDLNGAAVTAIAS